MFPTLCHRPHGREVHVDTLSLSGDDRFCGVLVASDPFTKWAEAVPLKNYSAKIISEAFLKIISRLGPMKVMRCDNGKELINGITESLYKALGITVMRGAVRHPRSQGSVERFNRTLLTMFRKVLDDVSNWSESLDSVLYAYRTRICRQTKLSPMLDMFGWTADPSGLRFLRNIGTRSNWFKGLHGRRAELDQYLEGELSMLDDSGRLNEVPNPFVIGERVLLRNDSRHNKMLPAWEHGWEVTSIVSPTDVVITHPDHCEKLSNIGLIKRQHSKFNEVAVNTLGNVETDVDECTSVSSTDIDIPNTETVLKCESTEEHTHENEPEIPSTHCSEAQPIVTERPRRNIQAPKRYGEFIPTDVVSETFKEDEIIWKYESE